MSEHHTPGPWNIAGEGIGTPFASVATVHWAGGQQQANKHLIAAAPDMLAALDEAEGFIMCFEDDDTQEGIAELLRAIRAAIAKATGV